ncbi:MAG TPA: AfsR/SARP family transcriptional regulator [Nocardioides sp.]|nr:AfsR/SARP family transcriptional regulator [Nocardioides sp.]HXH78873.1 AfsR/SARP family transcriptional regulator [Nocardioides sp.]
MLWGDAPPATAAGTVQTYVSQLRRLLEPGSDARTASLLVTRGPGYCLLVDDVDLRRFSSLVDEGARLLASGRAAEAEVVLVSVVALWRGEPLADLTSDDAVPERNRLVELHLGAREPLRERVWARLVEALYAGGRQAEALAAYRTCAKVLRDELGIDPGPELRELEASVLRQDSSLARLVPRQRTAEPISLSHRALHRRASASGLDGLRLCRLGAAAYGVLRDDRKPVRDAGLQLAHRVAGCRCRHGHRSDLAPA